VSIKLANNRNIRNVTHLFFVFTASAVMLTLIHPPFDLWWLAWVALAPFILVCITPRQTNTSVAVSTKDKKTPNKIGGLNKNGNGLLFYIVAYVVGAGYWLGNLYWVFPITWLGWLTFCLYTALLWPGLAYCIRWCRIKKVPLILAVPILFVGAERLQGLFLGGFFWRFLGHSQYANITIIQIADIFGAPGVSFLVGMVNGLAAELFIAAEEKKIFKISNLLKTAMVFFAVAGAFIYGKYRIKQTEETVVDGPVVGVVQTNVPQSVKQSSARSDEILAELLEHSRASSKAGAELIVWPETMVQATLDKRVLKRVTPEFHCRQVDEILREHARGRAYVLVGAYGGVLEYEADSQFSLAERYNSAFLYTPQGEQVDVQYNKIHLVPFGEVVPFRDNAPWLHSLLMKFTPYDYDYTLDYGKDYTVFEMREANLPRPPQPAERVYKFGVMICYEDTVPEIAARFARDEKGGKGVDFLLNISNDGWFVRFSDGKVKPSTELEQHTAVCVFRAVENRFSVVRSVNTGISCVIDTAGRIRDGFMAGSLPFNAMERKGMGGWFVDRVPIDRRTTLFNRCGGWLNICCAVCFICVIMAGILERFFIKEASSRTEG
jgi:apolipoprotein N-acyltransferase